MKKFLIITILFYSFNCCCFCKREPHVNVDFIQDLGSENNRVWGELSLDEFDGNLESLTYDFYINYLDENKMFASKDLVEKIKKADYYYFNSSPETFVIILQYDRQRYIIGDNGSTTVVDTVINWAVGENTPNLQNVAGMIH